MTNGIITSSTSVVGLDNWSNVVSQVFGPMKCDRRDKHQDAKAFSGSLTNSKLNRIQLSRIATNMITINRSKNNISQITDAHYLVKFQISGECNVQQSGREAHLKPGDFVICSSSEPYKLYFPADHYLAVLAIPQPLLHEIFHAPDDYLGLKMAGESPVHGLLSQFILSLVERMDKLEASIVNRLETNILDLLITSLLSEESDAAPCRKTPDQHVQHIKCFINMHLKSPELSPEFIAHAEGISKRYLHMLFKAEGLSVSRYIQKHRLKACHQTLTNPNMSQLSAADVGLYWGFGDVSHFHRCFKTEYGLTPRQVRLQMLATSD